MSDNVFTRIVKLIIRSHFGPVEFVLAFSALAHGVWSAILGWSGCPNFVMLNSFMSKTELTYSYSMIAVGLFTMLAARFRWKQARSVANLALFVGWLFSGLLAFAATGFAGTLWFTYITIALVQALVYLNVSAGVWYGTE